MNRRQERKKNQAVGAKCGIRGSNKVCGDGTTEEKSYDPVLRSTG